MEGGVKITVELSGPQEGHLLEVARRLNVAVEDLAAAAVRDLLAQPDAAFQQALQRVLEKNRELYERLR